MLEGAAEEVFKYFLDIEVKIGSTASSKPAIVHFHRQLLPSYIITS